jgi:hypothetical protein
MRTQCLECMRNRKGLAPSRRIDFAWVFVWWDGHVELLKWRNMSLKTVLVSGLRVETVTKSTTSNCTWFLHCCTGQVIVVWIKSCCPINSARNFTKLAILSDTIFY